MLALGHQRALGGGHEAVFISIVTAPLPAIAARRMRHGYIEQGHRCAAMRDIEAVQVLGPGVVVQLALAIGPAMQAKAQVADKGDFDFKRQQGALRNIPQKQAALVAAQGPKDNRSGPFLLAGALSGRQRPALAALLGSASALTPHPVGTACSHGQCQAQQHRQVHGRYRRRLVAST